MKISEELLTASYWEHFKFAKDLALIYPINHPKRLLMEKVMEELQKKLKQ